MTSLYRNPSNLVQCQHGLIISLTVRRIRAKRLPSKILNLTEVVLSKKLPRYVVQNQVLHGYILQLQI